MEPDTTFTRRVCAVLLADVTGFSKLMGENDERTAHAVQMDKAYDERAMNLANLRVYGGFDGLRSDPRFAALLKKVGLDK